MTLIISNQEARIQEGSPEKEPQKRSSAGSVIKKKTSEKAVPKINSYRDVP